MGPKIKINGVAQSLSMDKGIRQYLGHFTG